MRSKFLGPAKGPERVEGVLDHGVGDPWVDADPEDAIHHEIGVGEIADDAEGQALVGRLAREVAPEQQARGDSVRFEVRDHLIAGERRVLAHADRETEPTRVGAGCWFGQDEEFRHLAQAFGEGAGIAAACFDEAIELFELRDADRGLHVGEL